MTGRIPILDAEPVIGCGRYLAKAVVGERFEVAATVLREGHDAVAASVSFRDPAGRVRQWVRLRKREPWSDRWFAELSADDEGEWSFTDRGLVGSHRHLAAYRGSEDSSADRRAARLHRGRPAPRAGGRGSAARALPPSAAFCATPPRRYGTSDGRPPVRLAAAMAPDVTAILDAHPLRDLVTEDGPYPVRVDRERALYGSWYEFFRDRKGPVRSDDGSWTSGTFETAAKRLTGHRRHGIRRRLPAADPSHRQCVPQGRQQHVDAGRARPGRPWAIGSEAGGHDAIHPELGTFDSFDDFVSATRELGMEVALDLALQASPDHPWVTEHPEWFSHRADGTIAYAENPPKKYQDIYQLNFDNDPEGSYAEMLRIVRLWMDHGVRIFRVDNPHTKPVSFWHRLLEEVRQTDPDVVFLAEAFTKPAMMHTLAKIGFGQSYTYFTWKNSKQEVYEYFSELRDSATYMRPNVFVNTPDILHAYLQYGGPAAFKIRAVLAAMLSPTWGVYSGYELFEHVAVRPGSEEYLDSEKYQYRPRDWAAYEPGGPREGQSLAPYLTRLNAIRRAHPALHRLRNLRFHWVDNSGDRVLLQARAVARRRRGRRRHGREPGLARDQGRHHLPGHARAGLRLARDVRCARRADRADVPLGTVRLRSPRPGRRARARAHDPPVGHMNGGDHLPAAGTDPDWFKRAVFYEVLVRSFKDSDGDGAGDLRGLTDKLDYLHWLGVDCLWLPPFYPSPLRDGGYDVSDYKGVLPEFGTLEDFSRFVRLAHDRSMRVIIDFVMNHTSDQHPWFQASRENPDGPYGDFYVWADDDTGYPDARIIFVDTETSNWTFDPVRRQYFWHRFFGHQPDLNYDNPAVGEAIIDALRFWLDLGIDGFRLDAVPYLFEEEGTNCENLPRTHGFLKQVRKVIDDEYPDTVLLSEANQWPADVVEYFGEFSAGGDECHMAFHFPVMPRIFMAVRRESRYPVSEIMAQTPLIPANCQWGIFLRNHDELTLEMVTDDERDYMWAEYAKDPRMKANIGIRRRLAPLLENDTDQIELFTAMLLSLPGSPVLYYGDEIGMGDNIWLGDRDSVRTPMQWTPDRNAGFSTAEPGRLTLPVVMDAVYGYQVTNVESHLTNTSSLLHWTRHMIEVRKQNPAFGLGDFTDIGGSNPSVLSYVREFGDDIVLCVNNLSRFPQPVELDLRRHEGYQPIELMGGVRFPPIGELPYLLTLAPHGFYWFRLVPQVTETTP